MKRLRWLALPLIFLAGWAWWHATRAERLIPRVLAPAVPAACLQLVLVLPDGVNTVPASVWLLERGNPGARWTIAAGPLPASIGKNGTGWGAGDPALPNPGGYPDKKEGDGRSPAGVFRLPFAFGSAASAPAGVRLPWRECTPALRGVDDVKSRYYNLVVDEAVTPDKDWDSAEIMRREDGAYESGIMIGHNTERTSGGGSCIFLHIWKGPGQGTAGCTALSRENVGTILSWIDPAREPRLGLAVP